MLKNISPLSTGRTPNNVGVIFPSSLVLGDMKVAHR